MKVYSATIRFREGVTLAEVDSILDSMAQVLCYHTVTDVSVQEASPDHELASTTADVEAYCNRSAASILAAWGFTK